MVKGELRCKDNILIFKLAWEWKIVFWMREGIWTWMTQREIRLTVNLIWVVGMIFMWGGVVEENILYVLHLVLHYFIIGSLSSGPRRWLETVALKPLFLFCREKICDTYSYHATKLVVVEAFDEIFYVLVNMHIKYLSCKR